MPGEGLSVAQTSVVDLSSEARPRRWQAGRGLVSFPGTALREEFPPLTFYWAE